jgi:hypothetical protein
MTDHSIRHFTDDAAIRHVGNRLLSRTLSREDWTHEAHLAAVLWMVRERTDIDLDTSLAAIICAHNSSVGTINDDHGGYHATITHCYLAGIRALAPSLAALPLVEAANALLASPVGRRDWPLRFYDRDRLLSVAARRAVIAPDRPIRIDEPVCR